MNLPELFTLLVTYEFERCNKTSLNTLKAMCILALLYINKTLANQN